MKMAMPAEGDFDLVFAFMNGIELMLETGILPANVDDDEDAEGVEIEPEQIVEWLQENWLSISHKWQRVLYAGQTAIENACDPTQSTLEWKPEIAAAMKAAGLTV